MNVNEPLTLPADFDLAQLGKISLDPRHDGIFQLARGRCGGSPAWRSRKSADGYDVLALAQISNRFEILFMDLREDIRVHLVMRVPVPCLPDPTAPLRIEPTAELGLVYRQAGVAEPQPGYSVVFLLNPLHAWHPNIGPSESGQRICLGPTLFAGIRLREILFLVYRALTLQTVQFDVFDSAGVMNGAAADWWQRNTDRIPLTTESFLHLRDAKPAQAKGKT
jgi:hypothetical protein